MVNLPSTRYVGSKRKVVGWIWNNIRHLEFDTFLDALGGTGVVSYCAKIYGREVTYNDILRHNYTIGQAIIENGSVTLTEKDVNFLLTKHQEIKYPTFIQDTFKNIYYTDEENAWLDMVTTNIKQFSDKYKKALAFDALFQACLVKRPFNLFHRKNLYVRLANVKRGFGNKKTWDTHFPVHFENFVKEVNSLVFDNGRRNKALNLDVFDISNNYDLVYIDTPYFSAHSMVGVDYYQFYHFLEGLADYDNWQKKIDWKSKHRRQKPIPCVWTDKNKIHDAFDRLFKKFENNILVVSYRSGGIPNEEEMIALLKKYKNNVVVKRKKYKYVLSNNSSEELLFIGT